MGLRIQSMTLLAELSISVGGPSSDRDPQDHVRHSPRQTLPRMEEIFSQPDSVCIAIDKVGKNKANRCERVPTAGARDIFPFTQERVECVVSPAVAWTRAVP